MALPSSGSISINDIVQELGFSSGTVMELKVQNSGGIFQAYINNSWVNINPCSSIKPDSTAPFILPNDWWGYNHSQNCTFYSQAISESIQKNDAPTCYTGNYYTVTMNTGAYTSTVSQVDANNIAQSNFNSTKQNIANSNAGVTDNNIRINWSTYSITTPNSDNGVKPNSAIMISVSETTQPCQFNIDSTGWVNANNGNTSHIFYVTSDGVQHLFQAIITGNSCVNGPDNGYLSAQISYGNIAKSATATRNNCGSGYTGGNWTTTVNANTYYRLSQVDADNAAQAAVNNSAQANANVNGSCTSNTPTVAMNNFEINPNYYNGQYGGVVNVTSSGNTTVDVYKQDYYDGTNTFLVTLSVQEGTRDYFFTSSVSLGYEGYQTFEAVVYGVTNYSMQTNELLMNLNSITASITNNGGGNIIINVTNPQGLYIEVAYCSGNFGSNCARDYISDFLVSQNSSNSSTAISGFNEGNSITLMFWGPSTSVSAYRDIVLTIPNDPI
jgi:hypothetical protein